SLLTEGNARAASLGQAYTAVSDDIAGMVYNPATLTTLKASQASFLYQQGLIQDNYGQFMIGGSGKSSGIGLSVGYYNGGTIDLVNDAGVSSSVNAQKDYSLGLGLAHRLGIISGGVTLKYLRSTLAEQYSASAYAADAGLLMAISPRIHFGV